MKRNDNLRGITYLKKALYFSLLLLITASCEKKSRSESAEDVSGREIPETAVSAKEPNAVNDDITGKSTEGPFTSANTSASGALYSENETAAKEKLSPEKIAEKIIREADISVETADYKAYLPNLREYVKRWQGYISDENEQNNPDKISNSIIIRVPSASFENLIDDLSKDVKRVESKRVTASDVTSEWVDISARIKTKREVMSRYYDILKQAKTVEDILKVEENIRVIREEIEAAEGRLKYLNDRTSYSTINLYVWQEQHEKWIPRNQKPFVDRLEKALDSGWKAFVSILVAVFYIWPFLVVSLIIYLIWRLKWFKRKLP